MVRNGILRVFLFREMVRNSIRRVFLFREMVGNGILRFFYSAKQAEFRRNCRLFRLVPNSADFFFLGKWQPYTGPEKVTIYVCACLRPHSSCRWLCNDDARLASSVHRIYKCTYFPAIFNCLFSLHIKNKQHVGVANWAFILELGVVMNTKNRSFGYWRAFQIK